MVRGDQKVVAMPGQKQAGLVERSNTVGVPDACEGLQGWSERSACIARERHRRRACHNPARGEWRGRVDRSPACGERGRGECDCEECDYQKSFHLDEGYFSTAEVDLGPWTLDLAIFDFVSELSGDLGASRRFESGPVVEKHQYEASSPKGPRSKVQGPRSKA